VEDGVSLNELHRASTSTPFSYDTMLTIRLRDAE
jgi:hypothetical protein